MTQHVYIWGDQIPGNSPQSKTDILDIHEEYTPQDLFERYPGIWDKSTDELGDLSGNDTLVYRQEIDHGPAKMTYEDKPFLVPYLVEGSDRAILICPGGAYLSKSMENEGEHIAAFLNEAGISAFVLWYRSYPYRAPLMFLDAQRAVRYLHYHAADYGLDPDKLGLLGFSAGGHLAGTTAFILRNQDWLKDFDYEPDAVDEVEAKVATVGLIYPAIHLQGDKIVAVLAGKDVYQNSALRDSFADQYDMRQFLQEGDVPLFVCAAMDDEVVPVQYTLELVAAAREKSISTELHLFTEGGHGFGGCQGEQMPQFYHNWTLVNQWKDLYVNWLKR